MPGRQSCDFARGNGRSETITIGICLGNRSAGRGSDSNFCGGGEKGRYNQMMYQRTMEATRAREAAQKAQQQAQAAAAAAIALIQKQDELDFTVRQESLIQSILENVASGNITHMAVDMLIDAVLTEAGIAVDKMQTKQITTAHDDATCRIHIERIMQSGITSAACGAAFAAVTTRNPAIIATEASKSALGGMIAEALMEKMRMEKCLGASSANKPR